MNSPAKIANVSSAHLMAQLRDATTLPSTTYPDEGAGELLFCIFGSSPMHRHVSSVCSSRDLPGRVEESGPVGPLGAPSSGIVVPRSRLPALDTVRHGSQKTPSAGLQ
jgi:hypothetical protein